MEVHNPIARAAAKLRQHGHEAEAANLEQFAVSASTPLTEIDAIDAKRYRWLFGARTPEQAACVSATVLNALPQDHVLSELQCFYTHKEQADAMIDAGMAITCSSESTHG